MQAADHAAQIKDKTPAFLKLNQCLQAGIQNHSATESSLPSCGGSRVSFFFHIALPLGSGHPIDRHDTLKGPWRVWIVSTRLARDGH